MFIAKTFLFYMIFSICFTQNLYEKYEENNPDHSFPNKYLEFFKQVYAYDSQDKIFEYYFQQVTYYNYGKILFLKKPSQII